MRRHRLWAVVVLGLRLNRMHLGTQSPQGVAFPIHWQATEPGSSKVRTFNFPGGDPESSLATEWETALRIMRSE